MTLFGIVLRKPSFNEITAATIMAVGLWLACVGGAAAIGRPMSRPDAGAALLVLLWGCLSVRFGVHVGQGRAHLLANLCVTAVLLLLYQGACLAVG
ncbi:MAG TPA: hypothetical protein VF319_00115, partial [Caldimonas sp.]